MSEAKIKQLTDVNNTPVYPVTLADSTYMKKLDENSDEYFEDLNSVINDIYIDINKLKDNSIGSLEALKVSYTHNNNSNVELALDNLYDMINWKVLTITPTHYKKNTTTSVSSTYEIGSVVDVTSTYTLSKNTKKYQYKKPGDTSLTTVDKSDDPQNVIVIDWTASSNTQSNIKLEFSVLDINKDGSETMISSDKSIAFKYKVFYKVLNWTDGGLDVSDFSLSDTDDYLFYNSSLTFKNINVTNSNRYCLCVPSNYKITSAKNISSSNALVDYVLYKNNGIAYEYTYDYNNTTYNIWYINNADGLNSPDGVVFTFESNS